MNEQNLHFAAQLADRAVVLEKGQVRYAGRMEELAADEALQREYQSERLSPIGRLCLFPMYGTDAHSALTGPAP